MHCVRIHQTHGKGQGQENVALYNFKGFHKYKRLISKPSNPSQVIDSNKTLKTLYFRAALDFEVLHFLLAVLNSFKNALGSDQRGNSYFFKVSWRYEGESRKRSSCPVQRG